MHTVQVAFIFSHRTYSHCVHVRGIVVFEHVMPTVDEFIGWS